MDYWPLTEEAVGRDSDMYHVSWLSTLPWSDTALCVGIRGGGSAEGPWDRGPATMAAAVESPSCHNDSRPALIDLV